MTATTWTVTGIQTADDGGAAVVAVNGRVLDGIDPATATTWTRTVKAATEHDAMVAALTAELLGL